MQTLPISYLRLLSAQLTPRHYVRLIHLYPGSISNFLCHPLEKYPTEKPGGQRQKPSSDSNFICLPSPSCFHPVDEHTDAQKTPETFPRFHLIDVAFICCRQNLFSEFCPLLRGHLLGDPRWRLSLAEPWDVGMVLQLQGAIGVGCICSHSGLCNLFLRNFSLNLHT